MTQFFISSIIMQRSIVLLKLSNLTIKYDKTIILDNISLATSHNQIVSFVGENGSGKTSLLRCLATLKTPHLGTIYWNNIKYDPKSYSLIRKNIAVLMDGTHSLYPTLTVQQNINYYSKLYHIDKRDLATLIKYFNVTEYKNTLFSALSTGNKQKVSLILTLAKQSSLLILDEPDLGLDEASIANLAKLLIKEKSNKTIILTTHNAFLNQQVSDQVYSIQDKNLFLIEGGKENV